MVPEFSPVETRINDSKCEIQWIARAD